MNRFLARRRSSRREAHTRLSVRQAVATSALLVALVGPASAPGSAWAQPRPLHLADVQRIYVAELGSSEAARRERATLVGRLEAVGFDVVDRRPRADVMLSGTVAIRARGDRAVVLFETVVLQDAEGRTLWHGKFRPAGTPERQARRIAQTLRKEVERAVWRLSRESAP